MSDISRKRSRKAKLVPRSCSADSGDECDSETSQIPVKRANGKKAKKNIVIKTDKKHLKCVTLCAEPSMMDPLSDKIPVNIITVKEIKKEIDTEASPSTCPEPCQDASTTNVTGEDEGTAPTPEPFPVPIKFDIKVEVEKCDENLPEELQQLENEVPKDIDKATFWECCCLVQFTLTNERILDATARVLEKSTSAADKIMDIAVRNTIGHQQPGVSYFTQHEAKIQIILGDWIQWKTKHFLREAPMLYKCHRCEKCWWNLQEFRDHIARYDDIIISIESKLRHEMNIIAYHKFYPSFVEIVPEGNCKQCGKDYTYHKKCQHVSQEYYCCLECGGPFFTCSSLAAHMALMHKKPDHIKCEVCRYHVDPADMMEHLQTVHAVRSDLPIVTKHCLYKTCTVCSGRYINFYQHVCGNKGFQIQCQFCFRGFISKYLANSHMDMSHSRFWCEFCEDWFNHTCTRYEHMLTHTDNYALVNKCVLCYDYNVFISLEGWLLHMATVHPDKKTKQESYFVKVIVPKLCLHPCFDDSYSAATKAIESEQHPIKSEPEDLSDEIPEELVETLIKEEPKDEYDTEENHTENNFLHDIHIKEEYEDSDCDLEEYEDDIIKLDIGLHSPKQTQDTHFIEESENQSINTTFEITENSQESIEQDTSEPESSDQESSDHDSIVKLKKQLNKDGSERKLYTCTICGFQARHREYKIHIDTKCRRSSSCLKTHDFHCSQCVYKFRTLRKYLGHLTQHGYAYLACPQCSKTFNTFSKMAPHILGHVKQAFTKVKSITAQDSGKNPVYQCKQCSGAVDVADFFDHWEVHTSAGTSVEETPAVSGAQGNRLIADRKKKIPDNNIQLLIDQIHVRSKECIYCLRMFKRHNDCKRHLIEHLLVDAYDQKVIYQCFRCQICGAQLPAVEKYKQHMRDHANLPVYRCDICDRTFSDSSNFTKHKKVHNFKSYVCDLCSKKFQSKLGLMKHIKLHEKTEPIMCQPCDKLFYFESSYRRHMRAAHEKVSAGYPCVICSARFDSLKHKWNHMWEVHKERKNKADCPICHKSFRIYAEVRKHLKEYHYTNVTVGRLKQKSKMKRDLKDMLESAPVFRLGEQETLVVYE